VATKESATAKIPGADFNILLTPLGQTPVRKGLSALLENQRSKSPITSHNLKNDDGPEGYKESVRKRLGRVV
jgi:hypothetical protein